MLGGGVWIGFHATAPFDLPPVDAVGTDGHDETRQSSSGLDTNQQQRLALEGNHPGVEDGVHHAGEGLGGQDRIVNRSREHLTGVTMGIGHRRSSPHLSQYDRNAFGGALRYHPLRFTSPIRSRNCNCVRWERTPTIDRGTVQLTPLPVTRCDGIRLVPDPTRVIAKPFLPGEEIFPDGSSRIEVVLQRILAMTEAQVATTLQAARKSSQAGTAISTLRSRPALLWWSVGSRSPRISRPSEDS